MSSTLVASMPEMGQASGKGIAQRHDGWFTEGFDTPVLKDAKALLDKLG